MSLLTIVTVVKDDAGGLADTLESLQEQTSLDFTLLVLDGTADRDKVPRIIKGFPHLQIEYHWAEPRGVYSAMNDALAQVGSEYTYYLNAGDCLADTEVVARVTRALHGHPAEWAYGQVLFFAESGQPLQERAWSYEIEREHLFARGVFPAHQGVIVKTRVLREQGGFDIQYRVAADYASILKCAHESAPLVLGFPLARFRQGGLSTTEWRLSLREFHRARVSVFEPTGWLALRERFDTARQFAVTYTYRNLNRAKSRLAWKTEIGPRDSIRP